MTEPCALCGNAIAAEAGSTLRCTHCGLAPVSETCSELTLVRRAASGEFDRAEAPIPLTPEFLAAYKLQRVLGSGAMGLVVQALTKPGGRPVAIKVCVALDANGRARFVREGALLQQLTHPHLVPVLELGFLQKNPYLVTEYMPGGTLRARIDRDKQLAPADAVRIARDICSGLAACHARGIVHRDIKPPNILFDIHGNARIADLGIARDLLAEQDLTRTGIIIGTPKYMSPEQALGEKAGPSSDIYATGLVLYEMLAGRPPFEAENLFQLIQKQITLPPQPLAKLAPGTPAPLCELVHRMLEKRPEDRPGSALEVIGLLENVLPGGIPKAQAPAPVAPVSNPASESAARIERRKRPRPATGMRAAASAATQVPLAPPAPGPGPRRAAIAAGALVMVAVALLAFRARPGPDAQATSSASASPEMSVASAPPSASPRMSVASARPSASPAMSLASASPTPRPPTSSLQPPASSLQPPASSLQPPASSLQPPASSLQPPASSLSAAASPAPRSSPVVGSSAGPPVTPAGPPPAPLKLAAALVSVPYLAPTTPAFPLPPRATAQLVPRPHAGLGPPTAVALSPGGDLTAVGWETGQLSIFGNSGTIVLCPEPAWPPEVPRFAKVAHLRFSRDGRFLAVGWSQDDRWAVRTLDLTSPPKTAGSLAGSGLLLAIGVTDAGACVAAEAGSGRVTLWPAGVIIDTGPNAGVGAAFTAAGDRAAIASSAKGLECWELAPPRRQSANAQPGYNGCLTLNAGGDVVVAGLTGEKVRLVQWTDGQVLSENDGASCPLAQSPARDVLVLRGEQAGTLEIEAPGKLSHRQLLAARAPVMLSPDGAALALGSWRGGVDVWGTTALLDVLEHRETSLSVPVGPGQWWRRIESRGILGSPALCAPASGPGVLHLHQPAAQGLAVSDHGKLAAVLADTGTLESWLLPSARPEATIAAPVTGGRGGVVRLLGDEKLAVVVPPRPVDLLGFTVGTSVTAESARLYDLATGQVRATYSGHAKPISDASLSPDGARLATAGMDETVRLWKLEPAAQQQVLTGRASGAFRSVSWSPDGARVAAQAGVTERTCVWRAARGDLAVSLIHTGIRLGASYFATDQHLLLVGRDAVSVARLPDDMAHSVAMRPGERIFWERRDAQDAMFTGPADWSPMVEAPEGVSFISSTFSEDRTTLALGLSDGRIWIVLLPAGDPSAEDLPGEELGAAAERREKERELAADASASPAPSPAPDRAATTPRELTIAPDVPEALAISKDGRWLLAGGARTVVFDLQPPATALPAGQR